MELAADGEGVLLRAVGDGEAVGGVDVVGQESVEAIKVDVDGVGCALDFEQDGAVGLVADPAGDGACGVLLVVGVGEILSGGAEADSLDAACVLELESHAVSVEGCAAGAWGQRGAPRMHRGGRERRHCAGA